jgi:hypothetical protein
MPVMQSQTKEEVRLSIGYNVDAVFEGSTTAASPDDKTLIDTKLRGVDNDANGAWILVTSGARDGDISRTIDSTNDTANNTYSLEVRPSFGGTLASGVTYEKWREPFRPQFIDNCIKRAILFATGKSFDPVTDTSIHLHSSQNKISIPSTIAAVQQLEVRANVAKVNIDPCESGWTQQTGVTQTFNQSERRSGSASLQLVTASVAVANIALKTIDSLDLSEHDYIEFQWKSSIAVTTAGDITIALTSSTTTITLNMPTAIANTWTMMRIALTNDQARQLSDVTRVTFAQATDLANATFWIDDINAVIDATAKWEPIDSRLWYPDKESGEIVFKPEMGTIPYQLLKIRGGDEPAIMTADTDVCEVDPEFVISFASELACRRSKDEEIRQLRFGFRRDAEERVRSFPARQGWRDVR